MPADNHAHLLAAVERRSADTDRRAREALRKLDKTGIPITFSAVAAAANVSRSWLYRNVEIRAEIHRLRTKPSTPAGVPAAQRTSNASLQQRLESARDDGDALRAENQRLRDENRLLRDHLARHLGEERAAATTGARSAGRPIGPCS